jgi:hypothetical protein
MMLEKEGTRYLRDVFIPRRQAFSALAFQAAKDRGEIPPETDVKFLLDLLYGYSVFRLITGQIDDDQISDRIGATIAKIARSGVPDPLPAQEGGPALFPPKTHGRNYLATRRRTAQDIAPGVRRRTKSERHGAASS